ncbi:MAG: cytochrome D1 domain-containing protein [Fimbriimonadaceae bacterium]
MLSTLILASLLAPPKEILLVLNKAEDTVSFHDTETNEVIKTIPTGHGPNEVMVSPGGTWATISNMGSGQKRDRTITVLSMPSGDVARTINFPEHQRPHGMAWVDKNRFVVTTHEPEALHMVDASNGKIEFTIPCPSRGLHMVVLSPDKKMAYGACAFGNQMAAFDLEKKELVKLVDCGARAEGIAISPDGKTITIGNVGEETVTVIDAKTYEVKRTLTGCPAPIRTFFSPDGKKAVVSAAGADSLVAFDTSTWKESQRVTLAGVESSAYSGNRIPMNFAHSADGKTFFVVFVQANRVAQFRWNDLGFVKSFKTGQTPDGIAVWGG